MKFDSGEKKHSEFKNEITKHLNEFYTQKNISLQNQSGSGCKSRQSKLNFNNLNIPAVSQKTADKVIMDFIIDTFQLLSLVDDPSFEKMIKTFSPATKIICRQTLGNRISTSFSYMTTNLIRDLSEVSYVCTTADCWSGHRRAFIGLTAHWLDPLTLKRRSAALALRRIIGRQTYDVLANEIMGIHKFYKIHNKVVKMVTHNGTNFVTAFKVFGENEEDSSEDMELINLDDILSVDDPIIPTISLPRHQRCCCHNLNLIATTDAEMADSDLNFKRISRSTFAKCFALVNKQNMSSKMADILLEKLGRYLIAPNKTRWNSHYQSMKLIDKMLSEKFSEVEQVMEPLAISLKILEQEDNMEQEYLTPVLPILIDKLTKFSCLRYCQPLVDSVLRGIDKRFPSLYEDSNILAAMIHPKFKLNWPYINLPQNMMVKERLVAHLENMQEQPYADTSNECMDDIDAFWGKNTANPTLIPHIATKHDTSIKDKQRKKWRHKRLTRSRNTGMQDNKDLRLILTPLQILSTDISITTTTFPMAPLPCIFRHIFDDHHSPILDIGNMTEICAFCNAKMWNGEKLSKSSCRNIQFSTCCLNGKVHHRIGSLLPTLGETPKFAQLYIHDSINEIENRHNQVPFLDRCLLMELQDIVHTYNPFASQFLRVSSMIANGVPNISLNLN
ncbi:uncharacterized protein LOC135924084 [Gordionus sp. m RMFG-2023]|uniref:uncharacterized protein LOC135924084 n=1 Tax=Gordionus sp. m RMFG-2023 TaxID=3053472 RepID=UPI0031FBFB5B